MLARAADARALQVRRPLATVHTGDIQQHTQHVARAHRRACARARLPLHPSTHLPTTSTTTTTTTTTITTHTHTHVLPYAPAHGEAGHTIDGLTGTPTSASSGGPRRVTARSARAGGASASPSSRPTQTRSTAPPAVRCRRPPTHPAAPALRVWSDVRVKTNQMCPNPTGNPINNDGNQKDGHRSTPHY